jgi:hypothetical protein
MYQLKKNTTNGLLNNSVEREEKRGHNVYLKASHWDFLDAEAERINDSRNQALRNILDQVMEEHGEA